MMDAAALLLRVMLAWAPPPRLSLSEWADQHYYLSAESSAEAGRWHTLPYQREPMDCMTDPRIVRVSFLKSARVGYTKMLNALTGYHVHHDPASVMLVQPTKDDAKGYSKDEIEGLIRDCPVITERYLKRRSSLLYRKFLGAVVRIVSAFTPTSFRRVSVQVLELDEVDGYPKSVGDEGDPILLAIRRTEWFWNRKIVDGSTPTNAGTSRIERSFLEGDQRRYYVPCTQCGHMDYLAFRREDVKADGTPGGHFMAWERGRPDTAHFVCSSCGGVIDHQDKRSVMERGEWRAHAPFNGHASFHIWAAYSYSPNATWAQIALEYEKAVENGPESLKTFVNTVLGETWREPGDAPDWQRLYERRDLYETGTCPWGVLFLTCGVDVQRFGLVYEVVGWGRAKRSWSIDAGVIAGDPADLTAIGPWSHLDALLGRTFEHAGGAELRIVRLAVDSGDQTNTVYTWARRYPLSRVIAVKGDDRVGMLVGSPSKVDVTVSGRRVGYKLWRVSSGVGKTEFYGQLRQVAATDEARGAGAVDPPGYCRFPQYGEEYFRQITAERLTPEITPAGFTVYRWELLPNRQNHFLDARVYARAAAAVAGMDRWGDGDWKKLEAHVGGEPPAPPSAPPDDNTPPPLPPATPASAAARAKPRAQREKPQPWIRRRPDWIRKRN
jgi:phage terminase large subunit GpA-like protein